MWTPPPERTSNGTIIIITGYTVLLEWGEDYEVRVHTSHTYYTFRGLQQDTTYYCTVAAETNVGIGIHSNTTVVLTQTEATTSATIGITLPSKGTLSWEFDRQTFYWKSTYKLLSILRHQLRKHPNYHLFDLHTCTIPCLILAPAGL